MRRERERAEDERVEREEARKKGVTEARLRNLVLESIISQGCPWLTRQSHPLVQANVTQVINAKFTNANNTLQTQIF